MIKKMTLGFVLIALSSFFLLNHMPSHVGNKLDTHATLGTKPQLPAEITKFDLFNTSSEIENSNFQFAYAQEIEHYKNGLPYITEFGNSLLNKTDYIPNGMIVIANSKPTDLKLSSSAGSNSSLNIEKISRYGALVYHINGTTGYDTVGFPSNNLNYTGQYVSLMVGNVTKSRDAQISFSFDIIGKNGNYTLIFVNGPLRILGWHDNEYYEKINSYSSRLINLKDPELLPRDIYSSLKKITIRVQPELSMSMEFRIDLNKTTENVPLQLPSSNSYVVAGYFKIISPVSTESKYIFHNLEFIRFVNEKYSFISNHSKVVENGWHISNITKLKEDKTNSTILVLSANRPVNLEETFLMIFNFDVYKSLSTLTLKDFLLIGVILTILILFIIRHKS